MSPDQQHPIFSFSFLHDYGYIRTQSDTKDQFMTREGQKEAETVTNTTDKWGEMREEGDFS